MKTTTAKGLTKRQSDVLYFLKAFLRERHYAPSIKEICAEFGFASTNAAYEILQTLEAKGYITRPGKGTSRSIIIKDGGAEREAAAGQSSTMRQLTIIGEGTADNPIAVFMQPRGRVSVDTEYYGIAPKQQFFAAIAPDNAMSGTGIMEGDILVVQQANVPAADAVVVALLNDRTIIRTAVKVGKEFDLLASAKGYPKIRVAKNDTSIAILGVVKGVLRKL